MFIIVTFRKGEKKVQFHPNNRKPKFFETVGEAFDYKKTMTNPILARIVNLTYYEEETDDW